MTETPQQEQEQPAPDSGVNPGVNTENLRNYQELRRSVTDRKVAGVAGGLGRHLNIDPTIIRVAFVVLSLFGGAGVVLYVVAWLVVPEDGRTGAAIETNAGTRNVLLLIGGVVTASIVVATSWGGFGFPWPLAIIALIAFAILMNRDRSMSSQSNRPQGETPPGSVATTTIPVGATDPTTTYPAASGAVAGQPPAPPWLPQAQQAYQPPVPKPDRGPKLFGFTLALVAVALGSLGLYDVAGGHVVDAAYPALALAVVGVMLVVGAWAGRAGGLIFLGLVAVVALIATSIGNPRFSGDRRIHVAPFSASAVKSSYFVPTGRIYLDLRNVSDLQALDGRTIHLSANAGELIVVLPPDVSAHVTADVSGAGDASVPGRHVDGLNVHLDDEIASGVDAPHLNLNLDLALGDIEVRQS
jgi:phage shock protein PspC (stress-responsive transcriptional regulator)